MPGPTTESLATDFKDLNRELAASRAEFAVFREDFAGFRPRVETQLGFLRWLGAFTAAILVTLVGSALWLSWHASALSFRVEVMEKSTSALSSRVAAMEKSTSALSSRVEAMEKSSVKVVEQLDRIERAVGSLKAPPSP